jgi:UDP-N-acetylmuramate dehydrogenase
MSGNAINAAPALRGRLLLKEPMARHSSWRVGGAADQMYVPADLDDLRNFLGQQQPATPLLWLGLGSNLLVRDGGFRGTVIKLSGVLNDLQFEAPDRVTAGAGATCARVARFAAEHGLGGVEFLAGIPGTMGGALAMNAGAHGSEIWDWVEFAETLDRSGRLRTRRRDELDVAYRRVALPANEWFVRARLVLPEDSAGEAGRRIRELLVRRAETQPTGEFSCGSVFRNPPGDFAGRLIERCGLKGARCGAARISEKHANFIINEGGASARDLEDLIRLARQRVRAEFNVELDPEVRIVGEELQ